LGVGEGGALGVGEELSIDRIGDPRLTSLVRKNLRRLDGT
jgi:hypothetical protein